MAIDWLILEKYNKYSAVDFVTGLCLELQFWEMQGLFGLS